MTDGSYWMHDYFLNSTLRARFSGKFHQLAMGFIWRSQLCFGHYCSARDATLQYVNEHDPSKPKFGTYFRSVGAWEAYFLNAMIAIDYVAKMNEKQVFARGDGTKDQRIYDVGNHIKHMQNKIQSGLIDHENTMPIVLTNDGVRSSSNIEVSYSELFELLQDFEAIVLEVKDPKAMVDKHLAKRSKTV